MIASGPTIGDLNRTGHEDVVSAKTRIPIAGCNVYHLMHQPWPMNGVELEYCPVTRMAS